MSYYPYDTIANVPIAVFDDGAPVPVKQLEIAIAPVQTGTGDPAPDNVRPIIGFTHTDVTVNDVNQWDEQWEAGAYSAQGVKTDTEGYIRSKNSFAVKPGEKIYVNVPVTYTGLQMFLYQVDGTFITRISPSYNAVYTVPADVCFIAFHVVATEYGDDISFNYPASDHDYHAFAGSVKEIEFPAAAGTVYGGTLKYIGGGKYLLTIEYTGANMGSMSWTYGSGVFRANLSQKLDGTGGNLICTSYKYTKNTSFATENLCIGDSGSPSYLKTVFVKDDTYEDAATFKTAVNGQYVIYKLATPQTYEITADAVETLYRNNVIFASTGDIITLEYRLNQFDYYRRLEMHNFGYIMMDGGGIDLSSSDPQTINGAWDRTVTAIKTGKPIFAFNTKYGSGKNLTPVPVFAWYINSTTAVIVGATLHIQVTSDDTCVVQDVAPPTNRAAILAIDALAEQAVDPEEVKTTKASKAKK